MTRNGLILLVEDNADDVELTLRAFSKSDIGNKVDVVSDGTAALDYLFASGPYSALTNAPLPEVVLLDLNLPKIDGLEVLRRIRADARTRRLPVVVLSSSNQEIDIVKSYDLGANSFVRKPVDFHAFLEAAKQLGLYWLVFNQPPPAHRTGEARR